ncbi:MAG: ABC transporter permease [Vicinamibacteria bacterium]|nr:ABC transporter permease [Vicinamibacteria bacterium]
MPTFLDVRLAVRSLIKHRAFSGMAVLILALGIGANTAIFSVVNTVLIRSLPYGDPQSLATVFGDGVARGQGGRLPVTAGDFAWWRERTRAFSDLAALRNESRRITSVETPVVPLVHAVTANYFDVLGSRPALGRGFLPGEDEAGHTAVVVLGYGIWQSVFAGDPAVVGRSIDLDGEPHTVVGVMSPEFFSAHIFSNVQPGLFVPKAFSLLRDEHVTRDILVYGRLAPGRTMAMAQAEMASISADLAREHPETNDRWGAAVVPIRDLAVGQFGPTGLILLGAVSLVLLIACANVANLTLSRASERSREVSLRVALGANRGRIVSQLLTESLLLSLTGGALGALLAFVAADPLARMIPAQAGVPFLDRVAVDGSVLAFTLLLSVASGLLFGLFPAREATRVDLADVLREGGRSQVSSRGRRFRNGLVMVEVALAVVVAAAAGLMLRSFDGLQGVAPGFDVDRVLTLRTSLRGEEFATPSSRLAHFEELKRRLEAIPGIARASATSFEPPSPGSSFGGVRLALPGVPDDAASAPSAVSSIVMPDFFETLGIPVVQGRGITADDSATSRRVAVINQAMADKYFPGINPLGRSFALHGPRAAQMEIVGVAGNVMSTWPNPAPRPVFYTPYAQNPLPVMTVLMRVPAGNPMAVAREAESVAWSLSRSTNVYFVQTLAKKIEDLHWGPRLGASLLGAFAFLALLLGAVGIYAVISYTVQQRRTEIGLRMALGARASGVLGMVLRGGLGLTAKGVFGGLAASLFATRALSGFLYGVSPSDPLTLASVSALLLAVAVLACLVPAMRASRLNPGAVLKE